MNVKKKRKRYMHQIALACLLICSVVQWLPESAYADYLYDSSHNTNHYKYTFNTTVDNKPYSVTYDLQGTSPIYLVEHKRKDITYYYFVSQEDWTGSQIINEDGKKRSFSINAFANRCDKWGAFYQSSGETSISGNPPRWVWDADKYDSLIASGKSDVCSGENRELHFNAKLIFAKNKYDLGDLVCEVGDGVSGSVDNPILDSDIGCLVISKKKEADTSGLGDEGNSSNKSNLFRVRFGWKYKTTTGFSLKNNKYAQTFIQVRIQNRSVIYKNLTHKDIKYKLDSYGESAMLYESLGIDSQPLRITLTDSDFLKKYLPKYYDEINSVKMLSNTLYLGNKYAFQFRVVCTDDLSVIPSDSASSKWHCGRWTEVTSDFDPVTPNDDEQKTGEIDENGDFIQKDDDTVTKIDDSSSKQYDDDDDAEDDFNSSSKKDKSDKFKWDDFENLVNECKKVPGLIKSVFSFLPDWVLVFVAVGFGIWIFVLIKRAIV